MDYIQIGALKLNGVDDAAWVSIGTQTVVGAHSVMKSVQGIGQIDGNYSSLPVFAAQVGDSDLIDTPTWVLTQIAPPR